MVKIKNRLRQPLVVNYLNGEGENAEQASVHFLSKEVKEVPEDFLKSTEADNHIKNGNLLIIRLG